MKKNDVIFLTEFSANIWGRSVGAYRLATDLRRAGLNVQVIDLITEFSDDEMKKILDTIISDKTKIIGISTTFMTPFRKSILDKYDFRLKNYFIFETIFKHCRDRFPNIKIIVGGPAANRLEYLKPDIVFFGYGELEIQNILKQSDIKSEMQTYTESKSNFDLCNLDTEYQDSDIMFHGESLVLELTRGCRFKCKFCSYPLNGRKANTYFKNQDSLRAELIRNFEKFGTTTYFFADDTFNESIDKLKYFSSVFKTLPFKIEFTAYLRLDLIYYHREMIDLLKQLGLRAAFFGIESLNDRSALAIGKGLGRAKTIEILSVLKKEWGTAVQITTSYIIGLPFDTPDTVKEWMEVVLDDSFHTDIILAQPLYLIKKSGAAFRSSFDENPTKYGYNTDIVNDNIIQWTNAAWSFAECELVAADILKKFTKKKANFATRYYDYITVRGYGYDHEACIKLNFLKQECSNEVKDKVKTRIHLYKSRLFDFFNLERY